MVATVRHEYEQKILFQELHQCSLETLVVRCDVTREDDLLGLVDSALERFGSIDVLVNNAGYGQFGGIELVTAAQARAQLEVNTIAPLRLAQLVLPHMREKGRGKIINISSVAGRIVLPWGGWYAASKFALEALTDAMRLECRPFNVQVVSVLSGPVQTDFVTKLQMSEPGATSPEFQHRIHEHAQARRKRSREGAWTSQMTAELLLSIARSSNPRTRYVTTSVGKAAVLLRKFLPDRLWDRLIVRAYGAQKIFNKPTP